MPNIFAVISERGCVQIDGTVGGVPSEQPVYERAFPRWTRSPCDRPGYGIATGSADPAL